MATNISDRLFFVSSYPASEILLRRLPEGLSNIKSCLQKEISKSGLINGVFNPINYEIPLFRSAVIDNRSSFNSSP